MHQLNTPVLFLLFNRPDTAQKVFDQIRKVQPKQLFVAADGPRAAVDGEAGKCAEARNIIKQVDWDCELQTLFRSENLGCGKAVSAAITWFFEHVDRGVILEDDTVPDLSFFWYCEQLLERYSDNERVMFIGGSRFLNSCSAKTSYYFSAFPNIWGWATWKSTWNKYIFDAKKISKKRFKQALKAYFEDKEIRRYWRWIFFLMRRHKIDTWDYQLTFSIWINGGLSIAPCKNLISNIGFGENATHTLDKRNSLANLPMAGMEGLIHPKDITLEKGNDVNSSIFSKTKFGKMALIYNFLIFLISKTKFGKNKLIYYPVFCFLCLLKKPVKRIVK
jgi:hypothetical protein